MSTKSSKFCRIICSEKDDYDLIFSEYGKYEIEICESKVFDPNFSGETPTLFIGWKDSKLNFGELRISQKKIVHNLYWTFSGSEDKAEMDKDVEKFLVKSLKEFLPSNYKCYDCILDGDIKKEIYELLHEQINFFYFGDNDSLYVYNQNSHIGISLKSIGYIQSDYKSFVIELIKKFKPIFLSYDNLPEFIRSFEFPIRTLENIAWICHNQQITEASLHKYTPFPTKERDFVFFMGKLFQTLDCNVWKDESVIDRYFKKDQITSWLSSQTLNFSDGKNLILKYSNKKTITGRINCADKRFNPQLLPKKSLEREKITSIYKGGKIAVFDFVSFETKISVYLTKDKEFIKLVSDKDIHDMTGQILFENKGGSGARDLGKRVNHSIIYGIGDEKLNEMLFQSNVAVSKVSKVKKFLEPIIKNSKKIQEDYKRNGYIINPYKSIIYPQKEWAAYNNYVQSTAADMVVDKLFQIKELLTGKKSRFLYQVYDSFVFDIHPEELSLIEAVKIKLESNGRHRFDIEYVVGNNLWECTNYQDETKNVRLV